MIQTLNKVSIEQSTVERSSHGFPLVSKAPSGRVRNRVSEITKTASIVMILINLTWWVQTNKGLLVVNDFA